jgi:amino acid permease
MEYTLIPYPVVLGAGLLAMPSTMSKTGILLGCFIIVWAGLTAGFGLYLQSRCARYIDRGSASFAALSQLTYPNLSIIFDAAIAVKCFGVGVSYLIIIGDLMPGVVRGFAGEVGYQFLVDRQFWITAFMYILLSLALPKTRTNIETRLIVIPLSFLRRLDSLKYTSVIALVSIAYLVVLVVAHFIKGDTLEDRGPVHVFKWAGPLATLAAFPVIVFAYTCHQNVRPPESPSSLPLLTFPDVLHSQ